MPMNRSSPNLFPSWYDGQSINEATFCRDFLTSHKLLYTENSFFTVEGRMMDETPLKTEIYQLLEALKQTNYVKSLVTAQGRMDLEKKGKQSYQGWMYARLLAFSNGDLQSLYDRSDGFYRRQLILTTRERSPDRVDDPDIAEKMCRELEGLFLWAFEGLQRLVANHFRFTESSRAHSNREMIKQDANNALLFMEAVDYIRLTPEGEISSQELYEIYTVWCRENGFSPLKSRSFSEFLIANQKKYAIEHSNNLTNIVGRRVWGFIGIEPVLKLPLRTADGWQRVTSEDNPFI